MHLRSLLLVALASLGPVAACGGGSASPGASTTPTAATVGPAAPAVALAEPNDESIGGLKTSARAPAVIALVGEPTTKSEPIVEEATGETVALWTWPAKGLEIRVAIVGDVTMVTGITITAPSTLTTSRGIGIGAPRAAVESTYAAFRTMGRDAEEPDPSNEDRIVIGSIYGGTFFDFKDGKVASIFVGANAE